MKGKWLWVLISFLMGTALVLASCGPAGETEEEVAEEEETGTETPQYGGEVSYIIDFDTRTFDDCYIWASGAWTLALTNESIFIGSWDLGPAGSGKVSWWLPYGFSGIENYMKHGIAESWEATQDGLFTLHIRQGVHFHDKPPVNGRLMTADDVVYSINRNVNHPESFVHSTFPPPVSVTATDQWTVEVQFAKFSDMTMNIPEMTTLLTIWPKESVEANNNDMRDWHDSVGTGAFILTDYNKSSSATFKKNPNYWDTDPVGPGKGNQLPYVDGVKVIVIPDRSSILAAMRTAQADQCRVISWEDAASLEKTNPELEYVSVLDTATRAIHMRQDNPDFPWTDLNVRKALMMALDFPTIVDTYFGGEGEWLSYPAPANVEFADMYLSYEDLTPAAQEQFQYNPEKAKQLMVDAGYADGFDMDVVMETKWIDLMSIYKDYWAKIGVNLIIDAKETAVFNSIANARTHEEAIVASANGSMCFNMTPYTLVETGKRNAGFIDVPRYDEAHDEIWADYLDWDKRCQVFKDISMDILEHSWLIPLPQGATYTFWQPWVKNYHGEYSVGNSVYNWPKWVWIDQDMKDKMK